MQTRNLVISASAGVFGLLAVYLGNAYFSGFEKQQVQVAQATRLTQIVVASQDISFGAKPSALNVHLTSWPANSVPAGAFTSVDDLTNGPRVAVLPISAGEPVLASKLSGADGRATLSSGLPAGKLAFSIPLNEVSGVGGFVRPGDVVDVLLTRRSSSPNAGVNDKFTDVVLEAAPVLGIDQVYDRNDTKPAIPKTATLEVDSAGAQKLALSVELGSLSLALRNVADQQRGGHPTVTPRNLSAEASPDLPERLSADPRPVPARHTASRHAQMAAAPAKDAPGKIAAITDVFHPAMTVVRGSALTQYGAPHVD